MGAIKLTDFVSIEDMSEFDRYVGMLESLAVAHDYDLSPEKWPGAKAVFDFLHYGKSKEIKNG
jgi:hypothetical protein